MTEKQHIHETHPDIIKRLRRAMGHLNTTIGMLEEGRACAELAQQLHAVEKAIANAKKTLIHDHIDHCLAHSADTTVEDAEAMIAQFKLITKYL